MIVLELGPDYRKTIADLGAAGKAVAEATSEGLGKGAQLAAAHVQENFLSGQYLNRRTSNLARSIMGWLESKFEAVIGVVPNSAVDKYKYLLGDETKVITPKKGKYLAIPIGEALTSAGVVKAQYADGPRSVPEGFFIQSKKGQLLYGYKRGTTGRGKFRPLYVLKKSVTVYGTGALGDGVEESIDDMTLAIQKKIDQKLN